jgi:Fe-S cluster assembly iron-binding protein IscA
MRKIKMEIKDAAIEKLKAIIKEHKNGACLRVFMAEGGCGCEH